MDVFLITAVIFSSALIFSTILPTSSSIEAMASLSAFAKALRLLAVPLLNSITTFSKAFFLSEKASAVKVDFCLKSSSSFFCISLFSLSSLFF